MGLAKTEITMIKKLFMKLLKRSEFIFLVVVLTIVCGVEM